MAAADDPLATRGGASTSRAEALCETPWENHGVYDTTIVYGIDEVVPPDEGPFLDMDPERNTLEYRERAFKFLRDYFGTEFDVNVAGQQFAFDDMGRGVLMWPLKTGVGSTHQVYAVDAQHVPRMRGKFPLTRVALRDDGYFVFVGAEGFTVHGEYGGEDGVELPPGTIFLAGEYRMFDGKDRLVDTLRYFSRIPSLSVFDPGAPVPTQLITISCDIESDLFGTGQVRGIGSLAVQPDGSSDLDFRYVMHFPTRLGDAEQAGKRCNTLRAPRGR
ncbi:MAG: hypothetical protein AAF515_20850 [Pseudomonadota bacterium]